MEGMIVVIVVVWLLFGVRGNGCDAGCDDGGDGDGEGNIMNNMKNY